VIPIFIQIFTLPYTIDTLMLRTGRNPAQNSHIQDMEPFVLSGSKKKGGGEEKITGYVVSSSLREVRTCLSLAFSPG